MAENNEALLKLKEMNIELTRSGHKLRLNLSGAVSVLGDVLEFTEPVISCDNAGDEDYVVSSDTYNRVAAVVADLAAQGIIKREGM